MSRDEQADALCDALEAAEPGPRATIGLALLGESVRATWQALSTSRPELVAEFAKADARARGTPRDVAAELDRVLTIAAEWAQTGHADPTAATGSLALLNDLMVFTHGVTENEYPNEDAEIPERDPVLAVWQAAAVLKDLLEDLGGGTDYVTEPFPYPMVELIVEWPELDERRRELIGAALLALRTLRN